MFRMQANHPDRILRAAVRGMLPKTTLGRQMLRRLKIYADEVHPHGAQVKEMAREELLVASPEVAGPVGTETQVNEQLIEALAEEPTQDEVEVSEQPVEALAEEPAQDEIEMSEKSYEDKKVES